jgi:hypothetical protein
VAEQAQPDKSVVGCPNSVWEQRPLLSVQNPGNVGAAVGKSVGLGVGAGVVGWFVGLGAMVPSTEIFTVATPGVTAMLRLITSTETLSVLPPKLAMVNFCPGNRRDLR